MRFVASIVFILVVLFMLWLLLAQTKLYTKLGKVVLKLIKPFKKGRKSK